MNIRCRNCQKGRSCQYHKNGNGSYQGTLRTKLDYKQEFKIIKNIKGKYVIKTVESTRYDLDKNNHTTIEHGFGTCSHCKSFTNITVFSMKSLEQNVNFSLCGMCYTHFTMEDVVKKLKNRKIPKETKQ